MSVILSPTALHILQHALGVDKYGQGDQYRNYFVTGPSKGPQIRMIDNFAECLLLTEAGMMVERVEFRPFANDHCFSVTPAGIDAVALQSPPPPKLTRSQERYRDYRGRAEFFVSFIEFCRYADRAEKEGRA